MMTSIQKLEDSPLTNLTAIHGYYQVGDKLFNHKVNAIVHASRSRQDVAWNFNYSAYAEQASKPRMNVPLELLYRQRALQLRDQYDYLIIAFSGGADSDTVLKTFLNNNIKIDEIWVDWNISLIESSGYKLSTSKEPENMPSEWYLVIKPELDKIRISHPEIKIRISESITDLDTPEDTDDAIRLMSALTHVSHIKRVRSLSRYVESISDKKNVGVVFGVDKLIPYSKNNEYGIIFSDFSTGYKSAGFERGECIIEYFYWHPEFPEIVIEQGHRVWDYLLMNPEFTKSRMTAMTNGVDWRDRSKIFDNVIKAICYPTWDLSKHQVNKQNAHAGQHFTYMLNKWNSERFYQGTESFLNSYFNIIDSKFLDPHRTTIKELKIFYNYHKIGIMPITP